MYSVLLDMLDLLGKDRVEDFLDSLGYRMHWKHVAVVDASETAFADDVAAASTTDCYYPASLGYSRLDEYDDRIALLDVEAKHELQVDE